MTEPHFGLLGAGIALFGVAHLSVVMIGTATQRWVYLIPFFGPVLKSPGDSYSTMALWTNVAAQALGATFFLIGLVAPRRWLQRNVTAPTAPAISLAPMAPGASVVGRF